MTRHTSTKKQAFPESFALQCAKGESFSPPDRTSIAQRWLRWADEDLALAEHSAADADVVSRGACVWAHQAAEKALKALLILRDVDPPKLHDLDRLAQRLPDDEGTAFATIELPELTRWAIEGRYPADLDEATHADALKAIAVARQVLDVVRPRSATKDRSDKSEIV